LCRPNPSNTWTEIRSGEDVSAYDKVKDEYLEAREAGRELISEGKVAGPDRKTFIYVNNRLKGNALETIDAMMESQP
jgi:hypothetical protein